MLRNELLTIIIFSGIVFILLGTYFHKHDQDSWVFNRAWMPVPEWIIYSALGASFIIIAMISILFAI
ncbi:MAG: hypothetical protein CW691_02340 [Candidatus Bathyarchaeum sp.]|nr:MAG: hypothetical protein CW691_02340 [Candidatus Bathyarchaeum sp.]